MWVFHLASVWVERSECMGPVGNQKCPVGSDIACGHLAHIPGGPGSDKKRSRVSDPLANRLSIICTANPATQKSTCLTL